MADQVNANINVTVNTQQAIAQLRALTSEVNRFNKQSFTANSAAAQQQRALNAALADSVRTSGHFKTSIVPMISAVDKFSDSIERGRLSLGQYTRYAASQLPGMRRVFTREFDMLDRIATDRVKKLNTQFIALGESANGMNRALAMTPTSLNQFSAQSAIALQRQQLFNKLLRDGSTQLLNWGKNTQWAGRQLMVGFTIPLGLLGAQAAKVFKELEEQAINFKKVYGDMFTTDVEVEKNLAAIKELSAEMTKYGQSAKQTMELANTAAQSGARGAELMAATRQATRLAILGQMEQNQAIETTISLQTAFSLSNEQLAESINFLNSVENQTILSLQDVSEAIPRVASVIKGFGGDVQDLSVLLVAMKEGGVSAAEGANALKNSMARVIAPTKRALETSAKYGIALQDIVARNEGKVVPLFQELARALEAVGGQERQEILSDIFGKFQYARIGTLLSNIAKEGSQAAKAIELTGVASRDLAATAERELSSVEDAVSTKFTAALEKAKIALAPVGEEFLKALTPVLDVVGKILGKFDELPGGLKTAIVAATAIIGGIAPIVLMVTGLVANGIANIGKFILFLRKQVGILRGNGEQFKYYSGAELEAAAAAASLEGKTSSLTRTMLLQRPAIETLITLYGRLAASANAAAVAMPTTMGMGRLPLGLPKGGLPTLPQARPQTRNAGGSIFTADGKTVPGVGNTDKVPAMLTPGEYVVNKQASQSNLPLLEAINSGNVIGRNKGGIIPGAQYLRFGGMARLGMPRPITNPNQQRAVESQLTNWLDMQMRKTNVRELGKLLGRRQKDTELYRGMKMRPSDSGYENRFPKETQDALYRFAKTGNPQELSGLIGQPVAIAPRSFSTSKKVAASFAGDPVNVGNPQKDAAPLILKLKNDQGIFGFKPTERIGGAKQSKQFVKEKRFYSRGSQNEREIVPVGDPLAGRRVDAVVGRWGFDGNNVFIDTGAKLSRREFSRATKELDIFAASRFTPTQQIVQVNKDLQKLEATFNRLKATGGRASSKELGDLGAQLLSQSQLRFNPGTRKDKNLANSISKRVDKMLTETSIMFNRAKAAGLNKGGMAPEMAPVLGASLVREWAQRKPKTMVDGMSKQTYRLKANRGRIVPGTGNTDTVPSMLTPGEFVVNKEATQQNLPLIKAINDGKSVSYLNEGDQVGGKRQSGTYSSRGRLSSQTGKMTWATLDSEIREAKKAMKGWNLTEKQVKNALQKSASHIVQGEGRVKNWVSRNLTPDLQAINQYMNRVPKVAAGILKETQTIEKIAKTTGLSTARVTQELNNFQKGIHPITQKSASVMRQVALIDERMSKTAISAGKKTMAYGLPAQGGYQASAVRAILREREKAAPGKGFYQTRGERRYNIPAGGFSTVRGGGTPIPTPKPSAPAPTVRQTNTPLRQSAAQQLAREIRKSNPRLTSAQSLNLARLQLGRGQKQAIAGLQGMGGGGGRTPTFLGMPGMPEQPRQSMMGRMSSGIGKVGMGAGMGLSMAAMIPMMKQDEQGKFMGMDSGTAMMGMMGAGTLLSVAPMLGPAAAPVMAAVAGIAAVGITAKILNDNMANAAKAAADFGANVGGTANALNTISGLFGEQTPAQRQAQMQLQFSAEEQEQSFGEFQNYLGSELGQKFIKDFENLTSAERFQKLSDYMRSAIAAGVLDQDQATRFAKTIGMTLNDAVLGSSVVADLRKNVQQRGSAGLLELAEVRQAEVEASSRIIPDSTEMVGAGIQIIQDYANALALANEEFAAGKISYDEFSETATKARNAQEKYSSAIFESMTYTVGQSKTLYTANRGAIAFNEEMSKILSKEQMDAMKKATETGILYSAPDIAGIGREGFEGAAKTAIGSAIAGGMDANQAIAIMQEIRDNPQSEMARIFAQRVGQENTLEVVAFSETADVMAKTLGLTSELNNKFKELGISFLDAGGNLAEFQTFITNLPENMRGAMIETLLALGPEARQRTVTSGTSIMAAYGEQGAGILTGQLYTSAQESTQKRTSSGVSVSESKTGLLEFENLNKNLINLEKDFGKETALELIVAINSEQNGKEVDVDQWNKDYREISGQVKNIERNFPPEVYSQINIDFTSSEDIMEWSKAADVFTTNYKTIAQLNPDINLAAVMKFLTIDGKGKELTPEQVANNVISLNKAWADLEKSGDKEVRRKAMITIATSMLFGQTDAEGNVLDIDSAAVAADEKMKKLVDELGGKVYKADPSIVIEAIQTMFETEQMKKQGEAMIEEGNKLKALGVDGTGSMLITEGNALISSAGALEGGAIQSIRTSAKSQPTPQGGGGGGGGKKESPLKGFVQNILDQVKMWIDANATLKTLTNAKESFVKQVLKGQGIFDKLNNVKGINPVRLQEILGMGPEGVNEFLKKYVKDGKLTKEGRNILDAATAAGAEQTIGENIISQRTFRMQTRAAKQATALGASQEVMQAIGSDPKRSAEFLALGKKARKGYIETIQESIDAEKKYNEALDPVGTAIENLTKKRDETVKVIDEEIEKHQEIIDAIDEEIQGIQKKNDEDQWTIRTKQREIELINRTIEEQERQNELDRRRAESLKRQDELRLREASALEHDLSLLSEVEEKIRKSYDDRIDALNKVFDINERIAQQQKTQISLAEAITSGDIAAAAQARQQLQSEAAGYARDDMISGLESARDREVAGLTLANGMTREQAEKRISDLREISYQTSLQIRDIEDAIYTRNLGIVALKDSQIPILTAIRDLEDAIYNRETDIYNTEKNRKTPQQEIIKKLEDQKIAIDKQYDSQVDLLNQSSQGVGINQALIDSANAYAQAWKDATAQIIEANKAAKGQKAALLEPTKGSKNYLEDLKKYNAEIARIEANRVSRINSELNKAKNSVPAVEMANGGRVMGIGNKDSVPAMLTPGEFVINRKSTSRYGHLLHSMNNGSFGIRNASIPKYNLKSSSTDYMGMSGTSGGNYNSNLYNNTYSVNVNVSNPNASADQIANMTIGKIRELNNKQIRRRSY